jgi:cephalosporin hydroxylase
MKPRSPSMHRALRLAAVAAMMFAFEAALPASAQLHSKVLNDKQIETLNDFRGVWHGRDGGVFSNKFLGVSTLQNPLDVWITLEIMWEVKPDIVIECGTYHGGSALLWATMLEQINPEGRVITIDIEDKREPDAKTFDIAKRKVDFLLGSSTSPKIVQEVEKRVEGKRVLVILDSLHTPEHVLNELRAYSPFVQTGSYIIVQDTIVGPDKAIEKFFTESQDFEIDAGRERLLITNNMGGFLKRVKGGPN